MKPYAIYLRKSRADVEAEARGEGETLSRHRRTLMELSAQMGLRVAKVYEEVVSADTIACRPQVQRLLRDVEEGRFAGVICMDVDRLARGDTIDQGIILQTFLYAETLIVTPAKTYDPRDENDAEFFEMKMFFSRREYKQITRRMQEGRKRSVLDGRYMGTRAVYGYDRVKIQGEKGYTLSINETKAAIVRKIFSWYAYGMDGAPAGTRRIAGRLNDMGLTTDLGNPFTPGGVSQILHNPAYVGVVRWNQRVKTVRRVNGVRVFSRTKCQNPILAKGLHPQIIDESLFHFVQEKFARRVTPPVAACAETANPFSGLIVCGACGRLMQRKPGSRGRPDVVFCPTANCPTSGIYLSLLEDSVTSALRLFRAPYDQRDIFCPSAPANEQAATAGELQKNITRLLAQHARACEMFERGVYTEEFFLNRHNTIRARIEKSKKALDNCAKAAVPPRSSPISALSLATVSDAYALCKTPAQKNALLKSVFGKIIYEKTRACRRGENPLSALCLTFYPLFPPRP